MFASTQIIHLIQEELESRNKWIITDCERLCAFKKKSKHSLAKWKSSKEIYRVKLFHEKPYSIHHNPIKDLIASNPENYDLAFKLITEFNSNV